MLLPPLHLTPGFLLAFLLSTSAAFADDLYTKPADPLNLPVTVDRHYAVSALIPASGGVIAMTSADGTVYTLTFPQDALPLDTTITLVPVSTVDGLSSSSSGALWGLQMEPDGLRLYQPATLLIEPPAGRTFSAAAHAPAGYHAGGASFPARCAGEASASGSPMEPSLRLSSGTHRHHRSRVR